MGIRFACHHCGKRLNVKNELAGKRGVCPACQSKFRIPLQDAERSLAMEEGPSGLAQSATVSREPATRAPSASAGAARTSPISRAGQNRSDVLSEHESEASWYVRPPSGGQYGPASTDLLREWIHEGRIVSASLLWRDGWPQWREAREVLAEHLDRLPGGLDTPPAPRSTRPSPMSGVGTAPTVGAAPTVGSASADSAKLSGQADVGVRRRTRSQRRVLWIGLLGILALTLVAVLVVVANRDS